MAQLETHNLAVDHNLDIVAHNLEVSNSVAAHLHLVLYLLKSLPAFHFHLKQKK